MTATLHPCPPTDSPADLLRIGDPALAATLELVFLRPLLDRLPADLRTAIDIGAHRGEVTAELLGMGFRVVAVEPQDWLADRLKQRFGDEFAEGRFSLERAAASDRDGTAVLHVGTASTISSLEQDWTTVAFPEYFQSPKRVEVPLVPAAKVLKRHGITAAGFAKVDVEGHELQALRGLLAADADPPAVVMFEANQRFADSASDCIALLRSHGYGQFDIMIREAIDPIAGERFSGPGLPDTWRQCDTAGRYFYANIIAYHKKLPAGLTTPDIGAFMEMYRVAAARDVLRKALEHENAHPVPVQPEWQTARAQLRAYLEETDDWSAFLAHQTCRHMFVRGRWGPPQDVERRQLSASTFGRLLLAESADPSVGSPRLTEALPFVSTNTLAMAWYLDRIHDAAEGDLPARVVEIGGGFGALARLYAQHAPSAAYIILDLPEMLALQHYFLSAALPGTPVRFAGEGQISAAAGITLVPVSRLGELQITAEMLISTFAYSEMPIELQTAIRRADWLGARQLFLTGQLQNEAPGASWVDAGVVVSSVMNDFPNVRIDRYHIGRNYVLSARR